MAENRVYVVPRGGKEYLTRAGSPTQAARFTAIKLGEIPRLAKQDDLIRLVGAGTPIFEAPEVSQGSLELDDDPMSAPMTPDEENHRAAAD